MAERVIPLGAAVLAVLWCAAQAFASAPLAIAASVAALWATAALALRRRRTPGLARGLALIMSMLAVLLFLLLRSPLGASHLLLQLTIFLVLAPAAPLLYALTFQTPPEDHDPP
jgi:hypothetical protein